jgi:signal transduction histidine kinase
MRNVPNEDEFLLALLKNQFYQSSHLALPESIDPDSDLFKVWAQITKSERGKILINESLVHYLAEPVMIEDKIHGVFVVARLPDRDYEEVNQAVFIVGVVEGIMAIIALSSSIAWVTSGRILARLRLLTKTAHSISSSDLSQRIPVEGKDEIAELTLTFNQMLERLEAAFSSQKDFINDASHELRTPITIIHCYLEQLEVDSPEQREMLALIKDELSRMSRLVNDLLLLTKAERPDFLNLEIVEISSLTEELFAKARTLANRNWCLEAKGSGRLIADRQRLTQAWLNLAQNATQHTSDRDVIALGSSLSQGNFRFWVRDTGEGIAPAEQKRIFQRFARVKIK